MTLTIENEYEQEISFDFETIARQVADAALDREGVSYEAEISLVSPAQRKFAGVIGSSEEWIRRQMFCLFP